MSIRFAACVAACAQAPAGVQEPPIAQPRRILIEFAARPADAWSGVKRASIGEVEKLWTIERRVLWEVERSMSVDSPSAFGRIVENIGNVTDDWHDDLFVGTFNDERGAGGGLFGGDRVALFSGRDGTPAVADNGEQGWTHHGRISRVEVVGDLDGDREREVCFAARGAWDGWPHPDTIWWAPAYKRFASFDYEPLPNEPRYFDLSAIADAGDLDGDGARELVIGGVNGHAMYRPTEAPERRVSVVSRARRVELALPGCRGADFGCAIVAGVDLDGDGVGDIAIGAPHQTTTQPAAGCVHVYSGKTLKPLVELACGDAHARFGFALAWAGDLDGDGERELVVGAPRARDDQRGRVFVLCARCGRVRYAWEADDALASFGLCVVGNADFDGDGTHDIVVGGPATRSTGRLRRACVAIFSGANGRALLRIDDDVECAPSAEEELGDDMSEGQLACRSFGCAIATGDFDGDGLADLAIGSPQPGDEVAGMVYGIAGTTLRAAMRAK